MSDTDDMSTRVQSLEQELASRELGVTFDMRVDLEAKKSVREEEADIRAALAKGEDDA